MLLAFSAPVTGTRSCQKKIEVLEYGRRSGWSLGPMPFSVIWVPVRRKTRWIKIQRRILLRIKRWLATGALSLQIQWFYSVANHLEEDAI